ncbi:MAG: carboxylesterase family protein [Pseudomonadales bacterium]|nr:carboxylesterase family protein [Pseudomonadales bacterium]
MIDQSFDFAATSTYINTLFIPKRIHAMKKLAVIASIILVIGIAFFLSSGEDSATPETPTPTVDASTKRTTDSGEVIGFRGRQDSLTWLGIPFAKPPTGDLRWRAPLPADAWQDELEATRIGEVCAQFGGTLSGAKAEDFGKVDGSEDCLFLNIWAPATAEPGSLPVMFWIHGGGNSIGHGGSANYDGANLATGHGVIFVSINYRLGPFGWFTHPALRTETQSPEDNSGNYGTLDIIAALGWVRRNIHQFGGDSNNVTIFGESAGGVDVLTMMASPLAAGLYHRAIVESGGLFVSSFGAAENYSDDPDEPGHAFSSREVVNKMLIADGRAAHRDAAKMQQDEMGKSDLRGYLYGKSTADILNTYEGQLGMLNAPAVFGDGHVLPEGITSADLFSDSSNYNVTPVMIGTNRDEVKLFMMMSPDSMNTIFGIPYSLKDSEAYNRNSYYGSNTWKARGVDEIARNLTSAQGRSVFAYRFDWDEQKSVMGFDFGEALGAAHGLEIGFVFGNFDGGFGFDMFDEESIPHRDKLSKSMMSYWTEFAYHGNPGKGRDGREVEWTPWQNNNPDADRIIILDTERDQGIRMSSEQVSMAQLKEQLLTDTSFKTPQEHCQAYKQLLQGEELDSTARNKLGSDC